RRGLPGGRGVLHRHGGRGDADPRARRPVHRRRHAGTDHAPPAGPLLRRGSRARGALPLLARVPLGARPETHVSGRSQTRAGMGSTPRHRRAAAGEASAACEVRASSASVVRGMPPARCAAAACTASTAPPPPCPLFPAGGVLGRAPRSPSFQPAAACLAPGASGSYAAFSRRLEHRERRGLMRSILLRAGLTVSLVTFAACGGSEQPTAPAATPTTASKPMAAVTTTTLEEEYELDVIAEAEPDEGAPPLKVQFTASVEEESGGPFSFSWDFGDGSKSTEQNPVHTYAKVGEYTATLTVTNQKGNKGSDEIDIFVETDEEGSGGGD